MSQEQRSNSTEEQMQQKADQQKATQVAPAQLSAYVDTARPEDEKLAQLKQKADRSNADTNLQALQRKANESGRVHQLQSPATALNEATTKDDAPVQRAAVPGVANFGNFSDLGNGLFGTTKVTNAREVSGLVNAIRTQAAQQGIHQNIKVITGTHGDRSGHLVGEAKFYTEDLAHEGHQVDEGGWINVLNVKGKSKDAIKNWMTPGSSAIILAWCFSKVSVENWDNVHCYKNEADYHADKKVW